MTDASDEPVPQVLHGSAPRELLSDEAVQQDLSPGSPEVPQSAASLQTSAIRASWWTAVQAIIGLPLAFAVNLVVARTLGPGSFGLVASYTAVYALVLIVLNGGISDATLQWAAAAYARGERATLIELCRRCAGYHMFVEAPLGAVAAAVILHRESLQVQAVGAAAVAAAMFLGTSSVLLSAMSLNAQLAKLAIALGLATQLAVVTAAVSTHDAGATWVARIVVAVVAPAGCLFFAPRDISVASIRPLLPRHWPDGFARYAVRVVAATLVQELVFARTELLVLDAYGDLAAAGVFALAAGLAAQITAPVDAMLGPLIPAAASLVAVDRERAVLAVLRGLRLSSLAALPILTSAIPVVAVLTPDIYGARFSSTAALFVALGVVSCLQSALHPVTAFVGALRRPLLTLGVNGTALVVDLAVVVAFVPEWGGAAAVAGNSAGQLVALAAPVLILRRYLLLPARAAARSLLPFFAVAAWTVTICVTALTFRDEVTTGVMAVAAATGASAGALVVVRLLGGLLTEGDLSAVTSTFPRLAPTLDRLCHRLQLVEADVHRCDSLPM